MAGVLFQLVNLGATGKAGESMFSVYGVALASDLIRQGWVPCGTSINEYDEVLQTFYLPILAAPSQPEPQS